MQIIIIIIFAIGIVALSVNLTYFLFGFFPFIKARPLSGIDIENIKKYGICHKTSQKGLDGIKKDKTIKGTKGRKSYSTHYKNAAYFFANAYIEDGEKFNWNPKYKYVIDIKNLSDNQIKQLRIRNYDKAIMHIGDFEMEDQNVITVQKIVDERTWIEKTKFLLLAVASTFIPRKYTICILTCALFSTSSILLIFKELYYLILQLI